MKMNYQSLVFFLLIYTTTYSQVGIGTTLPNAAMDITASDSGVLVPRIALTSKIVAAPVLNPQGGGLITGTLVWNTATAGISPNNVVPGFYYWSGAAWIALTGTGGNDWAINGNTGTVAGTNYLGTTDAQDIRFKTQGNDKFNIGNTWGQFSSYGLGSSTAPTYTWNSDLDTGIFSPSAEVMGFTTNGTEKFRIPTTNQVHAMNLGTAGLPFYSFAADTDTGLYSPTADNLGLSTAATERVRIEADGDVGIGTTAPNASAKLDITSTNRGVLIPRVALTARNAAGPITAPTTSLLVYNTATAGTTPNNVAPGFYYWNGAAWVAFTGLNSNDWSISGNSGIAGGSTVAAGTNFIGTTDAQNMDFRTNNTFRGRFSSLGEFFVGTLNTVLTGDLCNAVGNATFPWAVNGYTANDGAGTYGQVTAGTTIFAGVQGEYNGTNVAGAGVRGLSVNTTSGTGFNAPHTGVNGNATTSGTYKFGVFGSGGTTTRSGGVIGYDYGLAIGGLGYFASNTLDYAVYGFGLAYANGVITGRGTSNTLGKDTTIGLGIYGGVMGGWVRGLKYGFHTKGETYSLYVDGSGYTNKPLAYLIGADGENKTASFMSTSMKPEVSVNGKSNLQNGKVFVAFDASFQRIISNIDDVIITATPQGKSNGIYIDNISKEGFWVHENNDGVSSVKISWIAITKIKGEENPTVPADLLASDFDKKMDGVMFNENNTNDNAQSLWWDGMQIRWDRPANHKVDNATKTLARPGTPRKSE